MSEQESKGSKQNCNNPSYPILAIDYGEKRVGLAISDRNGLIGSPLETINRTRKRGNDGVIEDLLEIATREGAKSLLLGLPQVFEKPHEKSVEKIKSFGERLSEKSDLQVCYYDESFSSKHAQEILHSANSNERKRSGRIDKISAALFLQDFLDANNKDQ